MNGIGEGIQKIKDCRYCQHTINHNLEVWETNAKQAQTKFKEAKYCEHLAAFERNLYKENQEFFYKWEPKGKSRNFFCTNKCCIIADNGTRPDLVIYKVNAYGDEWEDPNHSFRKTKGSIGIDINNIECKNCNQRERGRGGKDNNQNNQTELLKKYGSDWSQLKPQQQEGRQTTYDNWEEKRKKDYSRSKTCRYCPQSFHYDKNLEYLPAKNKVETELSLHETNCDKKNDQTEQQRLKQDKWEKDRTSKNSPFYTCDKGCWGKVRLDKSIGDWKQAKKQALADLAFHQKQECGNNLTNPSIAIYFSPNQGGNQHAELSYADNLNENDLIMEQDNQGEVYQEQNTKEPFNWTPWIIGGLVLVIIGIVVYFINKKKRK